MNEQDNMGDPLTGPGSSQVEPVKGGLDPSDLIPIAMDEELVWEWTKALRSGKYRQTQGSLEDDIGYCCLGVLCNVHRPGDWACMRAEDSDELNAQALEEVGLSKEAQLALVVMNDSDNKSFEEIAAFIEACAAQGIEAQRAETPSGSVVDESPVGNADAPQVHAPNGGTP